jgi:hypothetical protein
MRHPVVITIATLLIAAIVYFAVDLISKDSRAAIGSLTISGLVCLILFSAYDSNELRKLS